MLTELLLIAGAGFLGKKAIENPDKAKDFVNKLGDAMANQAMKSGNSECQKAAQEYYDAKDRQSEREARKKELEERRKKPFLTPPYEEND